MTEKVEWSAEILHGKPPDQKKADDQQLPVKFTPLLKAAQAVLEEMERYLCICCTSFFNTKTEQVEHDKGCVVLDLKDAIAIEKIKQLEAEYRNFPTL